MTKNADTDREDGSETTFLAACRLGFYRAVQQTLQSLSLDSALETPSGLTGLDAIRIGILTQVGTRIASSSMSFSQSSHSADKKVSPHHACSVLFLFLALHKCYQCVSAGPLEPGCRIVREHTPCSNTAWWLYTPWDTHLGPHWGPRRTLSRPHARPDLSAPRRRAALRE